ncbi:hypothetical protein HID58_010903 [Brassica napus]|uniref:C3H1-type domain-containing protein n=1 Tax=Brassica napus TaxID=3708 RepID=A0ABQ8DZB8_BRANA|nr:hypothetical protein HID58_010903 [Brassica napus]
MINQEAMWQMNLSSDETMELGSYPERPGEPDCSYYIRTGLCRFGSTCRFNHPRDRELVIATARMRGEYPERIGQPECEYYLKTGTCKFGVTCKFHHPRNKAGIAGRVSLNMLGYHLRSNEVDCAYFLRTGHCKFGATCKFNHPQPQPTTNLMVPTSGQQQSYPWSRASFIPTPRWQDPSGFTPLMMPQGVVWNPYTGQLGSVSPSGTGNDHNNYRELQQNESGSSVPQGGIYALPSESVFPERPGQPECQFYMKTGDCKFGTVCKFHHPRNRQTPPPDCLLSPIGLPLRPVSCSTSERKHMENRCVCSIVAIESASLVQAVNFITQWGYSHTTTQFQRLMRLWKQQPDIPEDSQFLKQDKQLPPLVKKLPLILLISE